MYKGIPIALSAEILQTTREWDDMFKVLKEEN